jgi:Domain of unknown function (DUF1992)
VLVALAASRQNFVARNTGEMAAFFDRLRGESAPDGARRNESLADRQIRLARESGMFDGLDGYGKPLPGIDEPHDDDWWIKEKLRREQVELELPPTLEIRFAKRDLLAALHEIEDEAEVCRRIESLNKRITEVNRVPSKGPPSTTTVINLVDALREWRERCERPGSLGGPS